MMIRALLSALCVLSVLLLPVAGHTAGPLVRDVNATEQALETMSLPDLEKLLEESRGKVVMINFFASWCPPCKEEIPSLVRLRKRYSEDQFVIVGLSVDHERGQLEAFLAKTPVNYPVYMADEELALAYGVSHIPHNTVYNKAGKMVGNQPGLIPEQDLRRVLDGLVREK